MAELAAGVRLMPTTGPTLLHSVWPDLLPDPEDFRAPTIWEATRFCVDEKTNRQSQPLACQQSNDGTFSCHSRFCPPQRH